MDWYYVVVVYDPMGSPRGYLSTAAGSGVIGVTVRPADASRFGTEEEASFLRDHYTQPYRGWYTQVEMRQL